MHIAQVLQQKKTSISYEFFPPKNQESSNVLFQSIKELMPLKPAYVSVTYGAGGSTRELTRDLILKIHKQTDLTVVSHLTCVGATQQEIGQVLTDYQNCGIQNIMALRGDPPKGQTKFVAPVDGFAYASQLVSYIKKNFPQMGIGVAGFPEGHPEMPNRLKEMDFLKAKVDAGADYICTQLFFENNDFYDFCERCELAGIKVPIIAGIMPITSRQSIHRMAELALGSRFPAKLLRALSRAEDDQYAEKVGLHWASQQVAELVDRKVAGIHFYTLNRSKATLKIYDSMGISSSDSLH